MASPRIALLIPTRNRPVHITNLLQSVSESLLIPEKVVIVSSGNDITFDIANYKNRLPIIHLHIEGRGQILQKKRGLEVISDEIDWVLFLDDDLLLQRETMSILVEMLEGMQSEYIGVGARLLDSSERDESHNSNTFRKIESFFQNQKQGQIGRGGQNYNYLKSQVCIETQWLNGASAWRTPAAKLYDSPLPTAKYAVYEDVIFSTRMHLNGKLIFNPRIILEHQSVPPGDVTSLNVFFSSSFWRLYFIRTNQKCTRLSFYLHQIRVSRSFMTRSRVNFLKNPKYYLSVFKIFSSLLYFGLISKDSKDIVEHIKNQEENYS